MDQVGASRWPLVQGPGVLPQHPPPLLADGRQRMPGSLDAFNDAVERQVTVMTTADAYLVFCALTLLMMLVVLLLTVRSLPPRLKFPDGLPD